jgi:hypothetical protein
MPAHRHTVLCLVFLFLASAVGEAQKPAAVARRELTSDQTRQLLISGGDQRQRMAVMRLLEGLRETTLRVLKQPLESYPTARPILCVLTAGRPKSEAPMLEIVEDPGGLKVQLKLAPLDESPTPQLERTLLSALLTELALRPTASALAPQSNPAIPRWLVDALFHEHHRPNPLFSPIALREVLNSGRIPSPLRLLARPEEDAIPSSPVDTDLARCLLGFLLNRPDGRDGLFALLHTDLTDNTFAKLTTCFPTLPRSEAQLLKEWTVQVASAGTQAERIALDGPQTEEEIRNLLLFDYTAPETGVHSVFSLEQFTEILRLPGCRDVLLSRGLEWESLRSRAHFLYAPILSVYAAACNALATGRTDGIARQLQLATLERESVAARLERIREHLNRFEAVAAPQLPSARLAELYRFPDSQPPASETVKRALDKAEKEMNQKDLQQDVERALDEVRARSKQSR